MFDPLHRLPSGLVSPHDHVVSNKFLDSFKIHKFLKLWVNPKTIMFKICFIIIYIS